VQISNSLVQGDFMYRVETFQNILYRQNVLDFLLKKRRQERLLFMFSEEWNIFQDPINYKLIIVVQVICKQCLTRVQIELSHSRRIYSKGPNHFKLLYIKNLFNFTQNSKKGLNNWFNFLTGCLACDQFLPRCMSFKFQFYVNNKPVRTEI